MEPHIPQKAESSNLLREHGDLTGLAGKGWGLHLQAAVNCILSKSRDARDEV